MCGSQKKRPAWGNKRGQNRSWNWYSRQGHCQRDILCGRLVRKVVVFWDPKCSERALAFCLLYYSRDCWLGSTIEREHTHYPGVAFLAGVGAKSPTCWLHQSCLSPRRRIHSAHRDEYFRSSVLSTALLNLDCADAATHKSPHFSSPPRHYFSFFFSLEAELWTRPRMPLIIVSNFAARFILRSHASKRSPWCKFIRRAKQEPLKNPFAE